MRLRLVLAMLYVAILPATPAVAAGPSGIAFAQAEEGTWWCTGADAGKAIACAVKKCKAEAGGQDCHPTRWCFPAGWSGLMTVWLPEFHSTSVACGLPGQAATGAALKAICDAGAEFTRCDLGLLIDPDGAEHPTTESWPGPAATEDADDGQ